MKISIKDLRRSWLDELEEIVATSTFSPKQVKKRIAEHIRRCFLAEQNFPTRSMFLLFDNTSLSYLYVSKSCAAVLGFTAEELKNMGYKESLLAICSENELEYKMKMMGDIFSILKTFDQASIHNISVKYDWVVAKKDGENIHVLEEMWFPDANEHSEPTLALCFLHDLSDYSSFGNSGIRKCTILKDAAGVPEKIFSRSYAIVEKNRCPLTQRERQILDLFSNGLNTTQVAASLYLTVNTIKTHRKNILAKLGAENTSEAIRIALKNHWLS